jgi:hypothetical protein
VAITVMHHGDWLEYQSWKKEAWEVVNRAKKSGLLPRLAKEFYTCVDCRSKRATAWDHRDYRKPLNVEPVCSSCNTLRGSALTPKEIEIAICRSWQLTANSVERL